MLRVDQALVDRGLVESREKAKRAILAGTVRLNGQVVMKASDSVPDGAELSLVAAEKYVSRGGHKLEHALTHFQVRVEGVTALDLGASTGGFTDCLLQHGAAQVFAVDVGNAQLAWKLRKDKRVVVMEKTNARYLTLEKMPQGYRPADLTAIDCSFISLKRIIPAANALSRSGSQMVALIKPQFEAGKIEADQGRGVIRDPAIHQRVLDDLEAFVRATPGLTWKGLTTSPLEGPAGNKEFLALIEKA